MTNAELIHAYYPKALRMWRSEYGDRVRVPVRQDVRLRYDDAPVETLVIDAIDYRWERGYFDRQSVFRVVGRYKDTEVEVDMGPWRQPKTSS